MGKLKTKWSKIDLLNMIGVFSVSLLVSASAVYFYSPVIQSHADDSMSSTISFDVTPVASVTLNTSAVEFDVKPTADGVFQSKPVVATVTTNSLAGYELYFSSIDNNTDMVHANSEVTDVIASGFSGTVTSSTMGKDKWGYSLDNVNFSKIPASSSQQKIQDIDHYPSSSEKTSTIYIGTKIAADIKSGLYSKSVLFSIVAHEMPTVMEMQSFDKSRLVNTGSTAVLEDIRDDNVYTVKKLADSNVWMTQNLRIAGKKIDSSDSDLPAGESFTIPASDASLIATTFNAGGAYVDTTYGGYYNFYTATAGWGTTSVSSGNSTKSICPKGWRLPSVDEYQTLNSYYPSAEAMLGEPSFDLSGFVDNGMPTHQDTSGYYVTSSAFSAYGLYRMDISSSSVYPEGNSSKVYGFSVRCIAK